MHASSAAGESHLRATRSFRELSDYGSALISDLAAVDSMRLVVVDNLVFGGAMHSSYVIHCNREQRTAPPLRAGGVHVSRSGDGGDLIIALLSRQIACVSRHSDELKFNSSIGPVRTIQHAQRDAIILTDHKQGDGEMVTARRSHRAQRGTNQHTAYRHQGNERDEPPQGTGSPC